MGQWCSTRCAEQPWQANHYKKKNVVVFHMPLLPNFMMICE
jgi:hypothetical protein